MYYFSICSINLQLCNTPEEAFTVKLVEWKFAALLFQTAQLLWWL